MARFHPNQIETQHGCGHSVSHEAAVAVPESQIETVWFRRLLLQVIHRRHRGEGHAEAHQEHSDNELKLKPLAMRSSRVAIAGFVLRFRDDRRFWFG